MYSNHASTEPILHPDGSLGCTLLAQTDIGAAGTLVQVQLSTNPGAALAGRFFLARCTPDQLEDRQTEWSIYARRPLYIAGVPDSTTPSLTLLLPHSKDPGTAWLRRQRIGTRINLLGPYGQPVDLPATVRTLLLVTTPELAPLLLPFAHMILDRGGRVTLYIQSHDQATSATLPLLPLAIEVHQLPPTTQWPQELQTVMRWADHVLAALAPDHYTALAQTMRAARFRLEPGFAHVFAPASLVCGFGACLACVVPTADGGLTRACVHGPLFPLEQLVR